MYYTLLPDGRLQKVVYTVNGDEGYVAHVSYEGAASHPSPVPVPPPVVYPTRGVNPGVAGVPPPVARAPTPLPHYSGKYQILLKNLRQFTFLFQLKPLHQKHSWFIPLVPKVL